MDEITVEVAIEIMDKKIAKFIKENKETNFTIFQQQLKELTEEREKIYALDEATIKKVLEVYGKEQDKV